MIDGIDVVVRYTDEATCGRYVVNQCTVNMIDN